MPWRKRVFVPRTSIRVACAACDISEVENAVVQRSRQQTASEAQCRPPARRR